MSAAHTDKIIFIFYEYKNHSKENNTNIICDILNHSQENFVIEIKHISWSCPDPIFFKNKYPNPILIQKNRKYPAGYPILILSMLTSAVSARNEHGQDWIWLDQDWSRFWSDHAGFCVFLSDPDAESKIYKKKRPRSWSHFSISAVAGVCVAISYVKTSVNFGWIDDTSLSLNRSRTLKFEKFLHPDPDSKFW